MNETSVHARITALVREMAGMPESDEPALLAETSRRSVSRDSHPVSVSSALLMIVLGTVYPGALHHARVG